MSNIDETAKAIMLNSMKEVFTYSEIEEEVVEETPAEKLRREIAEAIVADRQKREEVTEKKLYKSGDATTSDEKETTIKEKKVKNTIKINPTIEEEIAKLAEETPAERIDRISKDNVAQQAAKAKAKRDAASASAKKFQAHKKEVLAKGGRPVDALDSWQKKKLKNEEVESVDELNRYGKETGKATGSLNKRPGTPVKKGGTSSPVMRAVRASIRKETGRPEGQQKKTKGVKSTAGTGKYLAKQQSKKDYADRAKKAGFKSTQDYTNTVARYGGESNYKRGRGLGS